LFDCRRALDELQNNFGAGDGGNVGLRIRVQAAANILAANIFSYLTRHSELALGSIDEIGRSCRVVEEVLEEFEFPVSPVVRLYLETARCLLSPSKEALAALRRSVQDIRRRRQDFSVPDRIEHDYIISRMTLLVL